MEAFLPGVTPGGIARWMLNEATRRRALQNVTWTSTMPVDSDGNVWRDAYDAEYGFGDGAADHRRARRLRRNVAHRRLDGAVGAGPVRRCACYVAAADRQPRRGRATLSVSLEDAAGEVLMTGNQRWGAARDPDVATWGRWQVS